MAWLYNSAITELITALIIWALIERFGRIAKSHGRFRPVWLFLTVWAGVTVCHMALIPPSIAKPLVASPSEPSATNSDTATLEANRPELLAIAQQVARGGTVDKQTHDHFWSLIPGSLVDRCENRQEVLAGFDDGIHLQKEFWKSILLSTQAHEVVKTQAYEEASRQADPTYTNAPKSEAMLQAAASGSPYTLSNGQGTVLINEAYAKQILSKLDATSARLKTLFYPIWHQ
jgi:hypothetical protein